MAGQTMTDLILHHYPQSPVAEKVRKALGVKGLKWQSVIQPRIPPRPYLFPMNGGYRRIPVLQMGADFYCDSLLIIDELERRFAQPSLFPQGDQAVQWGLARWMDTQLFPLAVRMAMVPALDQVPAELAADRARLYLGAQGDFAAERAAMPHTLAQMRAQLAWVEAQLAHHTASFLTGEAPALADVVLHHLVWFIQTRYNEQAAFLSAFPALQAWAERLAAFGEGTATVLEPDQAQAKALAILPADVPTSLGDEVFVLGERVGIVADSDSGETPVQGVIAAISPQRLVLDIVSEAAGATRVHFPRVGYRITPAA